MYKECTQCLEVKPFTSFDKQASKKYGLRSHCKLCRKQKRLETRLKDPEAYTRYTRKYRSLNREAIRANQKRWRDKNPSKALDYVHQRRSRIKSNGVYENIDRDVVYRDDGGVCQLCLNVIDRKYKYPDPMSFSLDHTIALAAEGEHIRSNVQSAHLICNMKKGC